LLPSWSVVALRVKIVFAYSAGFYAVIDDRAPALAMLKTAYVIAAGRIASMTYVAIGMLPLAVALEAIDRRENRSVR
jgi:hypothetical protein